jgi:LPS sulfotransferase NodH
MSLFEEFPDLAEILRGGDTPTRCGKPALMIAMTPRTGSTHLCAALAAGGKVGTPTEIFNTRGPVPVEKKRRRVNSFAAYVDSFNRDPGGHFLFKTGFPDFAVVAGIYRRIFPDLRIVYLDRRDVIAQGVSLFRALASGTWHEAADRPAQPHQDIAAKFDLAEINRLIDGLEAEKRAWKRFFAAEAVAPRKLWYEDFEDDVMTGVRFFERELGLELPVPEQRHFGQRKLADALSQEWIARVRKQRWECSFEADQRFHAARIAGS